MYSSFTYPLNKNKYNAEQLEVVRQMAQSLKNTPINNLLYSDFIKFFETGDRVDYENAYMLHRQMLCVFFGMTVSENDNKLWLSKLCDVICAVCDEFTWALPAHLKGVKFEAMTKVIDLFSAETAMALSEIYMVLGDVLPGLVKERIFYEVNRRVVLPYLEEPKRFGVNNWSAVCGCGVGASMLCLGMNKEFDGALPCLRQNMSDFLKSYYDDGCCLEGSLYWGYGFGFFCYFAQLLYEYTDGKINYFDDEKVKKIASFGKDSFLRDNYVVPFSDGPHTLGYDMGLMSLLENKHGKFTLPEEKYAYKLGQDVRYRFSSFIRNLYWNNDSFPAKETQSEVCKYSFYQNAQWYINKNHSYCFCAKGGCNNEPHNHNDIGSFALLDGDAFILDDLGWASYTDVYFDPVKRYDGSIMCTSSYGHSVPIIDGVGQVFGEKAKAKVVSVSDSVFEIEYSQAYQNNALQSLSRSFTLLENGIVITDSASGAFDSFVSRFVTRIRPEMCEDHVKIGNYILKCGKKAEITLSEFEYEPRFSGLCGKRYNQKAYLIDFAFDNSFVSASFSVVYE